MQHGEIMPQNLRDRALSYKLRFPIEIFTSITFVCEQN